MLMRHQNIEIERSEEHIAQVVKNMYIAFHLNKGGCPFKSGTPALMRLLFR